MNLRILIIAENNELLKDIHNSLQGENGICMVGVFPDAFHAVNKFHTLKPDIVLADIEIPVLLGFNVASMISKISPEVRTIYTGTFDNNVYKNLFHSPLDGDYIRNNDLKREIKKIVELMYANNAKSGKNKMSYQDGDKRV